MLVSDFEWFVIYYVDMKNEKGILDSAHILFVAKKETSKYHRGRF